MHFEGDEAKIVYDGEIIGLAKNCGGLYEWRSNHRDDGVPANAYRAEVLWHKRMGHLNYRSLKLLSSKGMVAGMPKLTVMEKTCEVCIEGQMCRLPFSGSSASQAGA